MYPEHVFLIASLALISFFAVHAWKNGVVGMLWGVTGAMTGIAGGALLYRFSLAPLGLGFGAKLAIAFFAGLLIYLVARWIAKVVLIQLFEPDGWLHFLAEGFGAAVLSLVPSLLTIVILATGIRVGGTAADLRRLELLATPNANFLAKNYPKQPLAAEWRDGIESLPLVRDGLDWIEPLGRTPERTLVGLLIVSKKPAILRHLSEDPESRSVIASPTFQALLASEEVKTLNAAGERLRLLRHIEVRAAALDSALAGQLRELELNRLVDEFLLSPAWQQTLEGYQRDPEDEADRLPR